MRALKQGMRRACIGLLLFALAGCSDGNAVIQEPPVYRIQSGSDLTLFTATDTHYLAPGLTDGGAAFRSFLAAGDGKQLEYSNEMIQALAYDVQTQRPDVLILSGDLTNNGERESHLELARHLQQIEQSSGTRVYVVPGNHDLLNPWAQSFKGRRRYDTESIDTANFRSIYSHFGYDEALSRDKESLSYLAAPADDLWLLMLDTTQSRNNAKLGSPQLDGRLGAATLQWIDACGKLAAKEGAQLVAVMHHNLLDHSELIQEGFTINDRQQVTDTLINNGVAATLSGHIHIQDISTYQQGSHPIYDIANSALSVYPHQYGVLKYSAAARTLDYSTTRLNMELWAAANGSKDPNLLQFGTYSKEAFSNRSAKRSYARLSANSIYSGYTPEERWRMAETVGRLNEIYFAGTGATELPAVLSSAGYKLWLDAPADGLKHYVLTMAQREKKNNQQLHVQLP
ncbi:metallophosphoesterase [Paenibacillus donghaensis]|uniref:metallophosphoesterase n=1 Tax=Paenibacillus donghaensis TaxID=414771 RepID=UPI0012FD8AAE|nr:metallophosphoesterase [Paenibacillus donghaensis]